jgi:hypothetical protein
LIHEVESNAVDEVANTCNDLHRLVRVPVPSALDRLCDEPVIIAVVWRNLTVDDDGDHRRYRDHHQREDDSERKQTDSGGARYCYEWR